MMDGGNVSVYRQRIANKRLVLTMPAHRSFCIRARYKGLGSGVGFVLPVRALAWPYKRGVSATLYGHFLRTSNTAILPLKKVLTFSLYRIICGGVERMR